MALSHDEKGTVLLRLSLGVILLAHGWLKVDVFTIDGTVAFFESLGLPPVAAYLTIAGEILGGLALILGIYTKLAAFLAIPIMAGALWVHSGNGWLFSAEGGGWEFPALLVVLSVVVFLKGSGAMAIRKLPVIDALVPGMFKEE